MFFKILKKDIQRKKVMNIILFLFMILSSTLIATSLIMFYSTANSIEVSKGKANISDVIQYGMYQPDIDQLVDEWKEAGKGTIEDITNETMVNLEEKDLSYNRKESELKKQNGSITSLILFGRVPERYNKD